MKMKKILFDFLPFEDKLINGGALYTKTILDRVIQENVKLYGICSNLSKINPSILGPCKQYDIEIFQDITKIAEIVDTHQIDLFFVGIAQRYNPIDLTKIKCKIYIVCHDIVDLCLYTAGLTENLEKQYFLNKMYQAKLPKLRLYWQGFKKIIREKSLLGFRVKQDKIIAKNGYSNFERLIKQDNVQVITVSNYSKNAILYYFKDIKNEILVLYPPKIIRKYTKGNPFNERILSKPYFLLMSADRYTKNVFVFLEQFEKFNQMHDYKFNAIILGTDNIHKENVISIHKVGDEELTFLMSHAYCFIYPSLGEGFGYPPVEAMEYGIPVIAAHNTSISEICGKDFLYFNPLYVEDLFHKENILLENYEYYAKVSKERYSIITDKQTEDLDYLVKILTN